MNQTDPMNIPIILNWLNISGTGTGKRGKELVNRKKKKVSLILKAPRWKKTGIMMV